MGAVCGAVSYTHLVHDKPVLVTAQGTYRDMYLQGYGEGMEKRWDIKIPYDDGGARSSHLCPVLDFNDDGVDELRCV